MYSETKRVEYLDSIRGLAALFVLLGHTIGAFGWPPADVACLKWPFISILSDGIGAVAMFFVLSGYVLSRPYVSSPVAAAPRKIFLPTFYLRRFIRIWLPWFFVFVASILARKYLFFHPATEPPVTKWLNQFWHVPLTPGDFFRQCAFLLHDATRLLLVQDWSLGVELKGSLLIPLFLFLAHRKRVALVLLLGTMFLAFVGTGHYYISFIIGVLLAQYAGSFTARFMPAGRPGRLVVLFFGLLLYQGYSLTLRLLHETPTTRKWGWVITSLGCAIILLSTFSSKTIQTSLNHKTLVFLGRVSYSVYLLQFIIILCLLPPLVRLVNGWGIVQTFPLFVLTLLVSVAATLGCATLTYRFIELPAINLGHRLTKEIQRRFQK
jgi:peptidoglycan/LPS O-acetylase OafA/YrhL